VSKFTGLTHFEVQNKAFKNMECMGYFS